MSCIRCLIIAIELFSQTIKYHKLRTYSTIHILNIYDFRYAISEWLLECSNLSSKIVAIQVNLKRIYHNKLISSMDIQNDWILFTYFNLTLVRIKLEVKYSDDVFVWLATNYPYCLFFKSGFCFWNRSYRKYRIS